MERMSRDTADPPRPAVDDEGYLLQLADWSRAVATQLARDDGLELSADHWEVIEILRDFHASYGLVPAVRVLVRRMGETLGPAKGRSQHLLRLFPDKPLRRAARIAGLPKPVNCD